MLHKKKKNKKTVHVNYLNLEDVTQLRGQMHVKFVIITENNKIVHRKQWDGNNNKKKKHTKIIYNVVGTAIGGPRLLSGGTRKLVYSKTMR